MNQPKKPTAKNPKGARSNPKQSRLHNGPNYVGEPRPNNKELEQIIKLVPDYMKKPDTSEFKLTPENVMQAYCDGVKSALICYRVTSPLSRITGDLPKFVTVLDHDLNQRITVVETQYSRDTIDRIDSFPCKLANVLGVKLSIKSAFINYYGGYRSYLRNDFQPEIVSDRPTAFMVGYTTALFTYGLYDTFIWNCDLSEMSCTALDLQEYIVGILAFQERKMMDEYYGRLRKGVSVMLTGITGKEERRQLREAMLKTKFTDAIAHCDPNDAGCTEVAADTDSE